MKKTLLFKKKQKKNDLVLCIFGAIIIPTRSELFTSYIADIADNTELEFGQNLIYRSRGREKVKTPTTLE